MGVFPLALQVGAGVVETRFNRAERRSRNVGYFFDGEALNLVKNESLAQCRFQFCQGVEKPQSFLGDAVEIGGLLLDSESDDSEPTQSTPGGEFAICDGMEPGSNRGIAAKGREARLRFDESLLGEIFRVFPVACELPQESKHRIVVRFDEAFDIEFLSHAVHLLGGMHLRGIAGPFG